MKTLVMALCSLAAVAMAAPALVPAPKAMALGEGGCTLAKSFTDAKQWTLDKQTDALKIERRAGIPAEGYELEVTAKGVKVAASDAAGAFYAFQTVRQLAEPQADGSWKLQAVKITDAPRYGWRGILIDDCRHFFGKETIKAYLDLMAYHKLNRMHWHLTDDQGWRLEIPGYPELVKYGSVRSSSPKHGTRPHFGQPKGWAAASDKTQYGPFYYSVADIREIVAYAAERHITIVPEIELPGHFQAVLAAYPEYACFPDAKNRDPLCVWGISQNVMCLGNDKAIKFMEDVLDYVCKAFPGDVVHIGGDECPQVRWKTCPKCQARIKSEGLKGVQGLQPWATSRFVKFLEQRGKRALGWDEYLLGDVPKSAIGMSWRAGGGGAGHKFLTPKECVERGHDLVMTPRTHCYLDYGQGMKGDPYQYIGGCVTLAKAYSFDPCAGVPEALHSHILGGQGNNWSEYTWEKKDLDWKVWPRTCALAEAMWTADPKRDFNEFVGRLTPHVERLKSMGVNSAPVKSK